MIALKHIFCTKASNFKLFIILSKQNMIIYQFNEKISPAVNTFENISHNQNC